MELHQLEKFANARTVLDEAIEAHRPDLGLSDQTPKERFENVWMRGLSIVEGPNIEGPNDNGGEVTVTRQTESGIQLIGQLALTIDRAPRGSLRFTSKIVTADWFHDRIGNRQRISTPQKISDATVVIIPEEERTLESLTMIEQSIASIEQLICSGSGVHVERRAFELPAHA